MKNETLKMTGDAWGEAVFSGNFLVFRRAFSGLSPELSSETGFEFKNVRQGYEMSVPDTFRRLWREVGFGNLGMDKKGTSANCANEREWKGNGMAKGVFSEKFSVFSGTSRAGYQTCSVLHENVKSSRLRPSVGFGVRFERCGSEGMIWKPFVCVLECGVNERFKGRIAARVISSYVGLSRANSGYLGLKKIRSQESEVKGESTDGRIGEVDELGANGSWWELALVNRSQRRLSVVNDSHFFIVESRGQEEDSEVKIQNSAEAQTGKAIQGVGLKEFNMTADEFGALVDEAFRIANMSWRMLLRGRSLRLGESIAGLAASVTIEGV